MAVGCGGGFAKMILFIFNAILWIAGCGLLVMGLVMLLNKDIDTFQSVIAQDDPALRSIAICITVIGSLIFFIGFSGCCGAIRESRLLLVIYVICLFVLIIAQVGCTIFAAIKMNSIENVLEKSLKTSFNMYPAPPANSTAMSKIIDQLQTSMKCCGVIKPDDWKSLSFYTNQTGTGKTNYPKSCCSGDGSKKCDTSSYKKGCKESLQDYVRSNYPYVMGATITVTFILAIGIFLGTCLCLSIRKADSERRRQYAA